MVFDMGVQGASCSLRVAECNASMVGQVNPAFLFIPLVCVVCAGRQRLGKKKNNGDLRCKHWKQPRCR